MLEMMDEVKGLILVKRWYETRKRRKFKGFFKVDDIGMIFIFATTKMERHAYK